jgi:DNA-binding CsgD family transcriptional regulator
MNDIGLFFWGAFLGAAAIIGLVWVLRLARPKPKPPLPLPPFKSTSLPIPPTPLSSGNSADFPADAVFIRTEFKSKPDPLQQTAWEKLTPRKRQVALLVARGHSNAEVAAELTIRKSTVEGYLKDIYRDLNIRSRTELANFVRDIAL